MDRWKGSTLGAHDAAAAARELRGVRVVAPARERRQRRRWLRLAARRLIGWWRARRVP